jgi:hypothetical protein
MGVGPAIQQLRAVTPRCNVANRSRSALPVGLCTTTEANVTPGACRHTTAVGCALQAGRGCSLGLCGQIGFVDTAVDRS